MFRSTLTACFAALTLAVALPVAAEESDGNAVPIEFDPYDFSFKKEFALGVRQHRLSSAQRVVGWQLSDHWYFGKNRGDEDGFGLIWQTTASTQVAITHEGVMFKRQL